MIAGLDKVDSEVRVFHCGTKKGPQGFETNGGRVLAVVANGATRQDARAKAYAAAEGITFDGRQRRTDIGKLHFE